MDEGLGACGVPLPGTGLVPGGGAPHSPGESKVWVCIFSSMGSPVGEERDTIAMDEGRGRVGFHHWGLH
jgi:hypothetical protein